MIVVRHGLRSVLRDIRSGELLVLVAAITLAVAATTAVGVPSTRAHGHATINTVIARSAIPVKAKVKAETTKTAGTK